MIEHVVLFRFQEGVRGAQIDAAGAALKGLHASVPGIESIVFGENFTERGKGYTHMLIVRLRDRAALDAYLPHPEHQRVVRESFQPIAADVLAMDIESPAVP